MQPRNRSSLPVVASVIALITGVVVVVGALALPRGRATDAPGGVGGVLVTIYPQPTMPGVATIAPPVEQVTIAPTPAIEPTAAPRLTQYVVQPNDTLWDIAIRFGFSTLDPILAVNPGLNPDFLSLGQTIQIPGTDFVPAPGAAPTFESAPQQPSNTNPAVVIGEVMASAGGLRLRESPSYDGNVLTRLGPNTQLQILGQVAGENWIKVITPNGTQGYVDAQYVSVGQAAVLPTQAPLAGESVAPPAVGPLDYPFLSDVSTRAFSIYQAGKARGNRANAFSVIGDSNSQHPAFLKPIDWGNYNLANFAYLQSTVDFFRGSFAVDSPASIGGFNTTKVLDPGSSPGWCNGQSPLVCEYNRTRPSVALILLGTGDQHGWQDFEGRYRQIIQTSIDMGVIPVLITKPDDLECRDNSAPCGFINGKISALAFEYSVPLLNLRQVVQPLPSGGTTGDGFHFSFPPGDKSAWFSNEYLQYGYTQRNLTALQTLDVLRRKIITPGA